MGCGIESEEMRKSAILSLIFLVALPVYSQRGGNRGAPQQAEAAAPATAPKLEEKTSKTEHSIQINGQNLKYTAVAGTLLLKKEDGTPTASIFYTAYTKDEV